VFVPLLASQTVSLTIRWNITSKQGGRKQQVDYFQSHIVILSLSGTSLMHLSIFQFSVFNNIVVNSLTNSCILMEESKRLFVISSKCRQISVQFSHFEHYFVILLIHICRTPYEGSRDDSIGQGQGDMQVNDDATHR
jgi:hypothetical protein